MQLRDDERRNTMISGAMLKSDSGRLDQLPTDGDVRTQRSAGAMKVCIIGASGKLGRYMVQHALDRGYEVVGVCREESVAKLDAFKGRITIVPGATDDREVIKRAVAGCDAVLVVLVPHGVYGYSTGTAQAVLDYVEPGARLVFSCGWHITRDGQDVYSWRLKALVNIFGRLARLARFADLDDQVEACRRVFASDTRWTVVRGSDLEEGESQGLPVWSRHVGDPILKSNMTRRVDFALFMVAAIENDELIHEAPAIVGCRTPSALAHTASEDGMAADNRGNASERQSEIGSSAPRRG
jgi:NAD(P)-dependent dehydrogenase (short-subunit alcohol dehydrogenase family)